MDDLTMSDLQSTNFSGFPDFTEQEADALHQNIQPPATPSPISGNDTSGEHDDFRDLFEPDTAIPSIEPSTPTQVKDGNTEAFEKNSAAYGINNETPVNLLTPTNIVGLKNESADPALFSTDDMDAIFGKSTMFDDNFKLDEAYKLEASSPLPWTSDVKLTATEALASPFEPETKLDYSYADGAERKTDKSGTEEKETEGANLARSQPPAQTQGRGGLKIKCAKQRDATSIGSRTLQLIPTSPVRTRFAPSPTGDLHLGSLRTALYNYLIAKRTGGQFVLRIEDTDTKRTVQGAEERIYRDLRWAGLEWDEGPEVGGPYGPYRQSERRDLYVKHAHQLVEDGHAYRCFCNAEKLYVKGTLAKGGGGFGVGGYDRTCYHISKEESDDRADQGQPFVVRLKAQDVPFTAKDLTYGKIDLPRAMGGKHSGKFRDPVLLKTDGLPTYHFANIIDDHYMEITHVIRGDEWLISTPLHLELYKAMGWREPVWCHVGLLFGKDGAKLSKRQGSFNMEGMKQSGILPEALSNYLVLLGWSHPDKSDFKTMKQLESEFTLKFSKGNPIVGMEKLDYLSPKHAVARVEKGGKDYEEMLDLVVDHVRKLCHENADNLLPAMTKDEESQRKYIDAVLRLDAKNYRTALDFVASHAYMFLRRPTEKGLSGVQGSSYQIHASWGEQQQQFRSRILEHLEPLALDPAQWTHDALAKAVAELQSSLHAESLTPVAGKEISGQQQSASRSISNLVWKELRSSVCFSQQGPSVVDVMLLLGSDTVLDRIRNVKVVQIVKKWEAK
ncbi:hypothetical protein FKW77_001713 [Venturia effusa]|uniref:Glutamate--tRNA ligase, mitochondrial n=1 Tax=Venturia effusa TaxID=50376 RepID=A0A517LJX4_9PEZI|nr:hypothetical protein FKW77_001713 [Venturia effusa]